MLVDKFKTIKAQEKPPTPHIWLAVENLVDTRPDMYGNISKQDLAHLQDVVLPEIMIPFVERRILEHTQKGWKAMKQRLVDLNI